MSKRVCFQLASLNYLRIRGSICVWDQLKEVAVEASKDDAAPPEGDEDDGEDEEEEVEEDIGRNPLAPTLFWLCYSH
jgi:hypothetical protein